MKNTRALPALISVGASSAVIFGAIFAFAVNRETVGLICAVAAVVLLVGGLGWLTMERRRVRRVEVEYIEQHPGADIQPPSS